jgi:hypothetical protein
MWLYKSTVNTSSRLLRFSLSCFILFFLLLSFTPLHAQLWINGYVKDKLSQNPVANVEVRSSLSNTLSDSNGFFRIRAIEGDIISVKKFGYRFDTIHFSFHSFQGNLIIYMDPLGSIMKNVTVKTSYSAYQVDSMRRRMLFDEGRSKTSFVSKQYHQGFGLVLNLDRLSKSKDKHLKKQREIYEKTEQWSYIRYRFSDSIVQSYTGITGDSLRIFMNHYTPPYEWLRAHPSKIEVVYYINDKLKLFRKENNH